MDICCRICRRKELKHFFPLNYQSDYSDTVLSMMQSMTGLEGALGDKLPQQICRICMGSLVAGYELRQLCIESYTYFQKTIQTDNQKLSREETLPCDEFDDNDLESCLTLGQIKFEPFVDAEEMVTDLVETDNVGYKENGTEDKFYCCFPNCGVNYQFKELLIEHAASDHQLEKKSNAAKCNESEFYCIVCARSFTDEINLVEHRNRKKTAMFHCLYCGYQTESKALYGEHTRAHNKKEKVCECGFKTTLTFSFKRHQAKCVPSKRKRPVRQQKWNALEEHIADDKTNDEMMAMGFILSRHTSMFYCCISHCATVCETQQQLSDHFQTAHPEVRVENMNSDSGSRNVVRCPICFHGLPTKKALQIHLEDAYAPTFRCNTCRYNCTSRKSAILHASTSCVAKMHRCSCGYSTSYLGTIKRHIQASGCPQEGSTLKYVRTKRNKSNNHIGPRKQLPKCKYCEKSFTTLENLRRHMDSELSLALAKQEAHDAGKQIEGSEQKEYTCHWCNVIVNDVTHLVQCMVNSEMIAGQDQEYKCTKCNESFKMYNQYVEHTTNQVCSVESWLSCKHCGIKFPNKNTLVKHVAELHLTSDRFDKAKRHECEDCLQRFGTLFSLNRHRKNIHNAVEDNKETSKKVKN